MMPLPFGQEIKSLRRRYLLVVTARLLEFCFIFAGLFALLALGVDCTGLIETTLFRPWPVLAAAAVFGTGTGLAAKQPFLTALIAADTRLGTQDLLSSAWEVFLRNRVTPFTGTLLSNAAGFMAQTGPKKIFPLRPSRSLVLVPICAGLGLMLTMAIPEPGPDISATSGMAPELQAQVARFTQGLATQDDEQTQQKRFQQIEKTAAQMLNSGKQARKKAARSFSGLLQTIDAQNQQDLEQLKDQLNMESENNNMTIPNPMPGPDRHQTPVDLEDLKEKIKEAFDKEVPEHLSRQLAHIAANRELMKHIENLLKKHGHSTENPEKETSAPGSKDLPDPVIQDQENPAAGPGSQGDANSRKQGATPGRLTPEERKQVPGKLAKASGRVEKDTVGDFEKGSFRYAVKALTRIHRTEKPAQEIRKEYVRQNEAVMQKERIPPAYRESIRDYFLSIGLQEE